MKYEYVITDGPGTLVAHGTFGVLIAGRNGTLDIFGAEGDLFDNCKLTAMVSFAACADNCTTGLLPSEVE
jgi:hypothetical protein